MLQRVSPFVFPHDVEVRALIIFMDDSAFFFVILMCSPKLRPGSRARPRILKFLTVGMRVLFIFRFSTTLCFVGVCGENGGVDMSGFSTRSLFFVQLNMLLRCG
jgi:hypothetical protein